MSDIEQRVKKIVAEQLGVAEASKSIPRSLTTSAQIPWTPLNW
jgi:acyl carrier protein